MFDKLFELVYPQTYAATKAALAVAGLTPLQTRFVLAYLNPDDIRRNGTKAARAAGYNATYGSLRVIAHENLRNPKIRAVVEAFYVHYPAEFGALLERARAYDT